MANVIGMMRKADERGRESDKDSLSPFAISAAEAAINLLVPFESCCEISPSRLAEIGSTRPSPLLLYEADAI